MIGNNYVLGENDIFVIKTPFNPHLPYEEGLHLVVVPKAALSSAWENPEIAGAAFRLAAQACKVMEQLKMAPWFNIQANANWGLLPESQPFFHLHIYDRNKTANWGKPLVLPEAPGTYQHAPMPDSDRNRLVTAFTRYL